MDKAKAAVSSFISKSGQHDTTVHESVDNAVEHKTINAHQREERQIATDREVHQDHYHTTVQPVHDREVLAEQHHHNIVPIEHRTHDHRDTTDTDTKLRAAKEQFQHKEVRNEMQHTQQAMPTVAGEHVHHHIHETIQPIVQKETIEPHVMHTTVPIHEVHHHKAQHHAASALPAMSMADFQKGGGALTGRAERVDHFKGEPKNIGHALGGNEGLRDSGISSGSAGGLGSGFAGGLSNTGTGHHHGAGTAVGTGAGVGGAALAGEQLAHRDRDHGRGFGHDTTTTTNTNTSTGSSRTPIADRMSNTGTSGVGSTGTSGLGSTGASNVGATGAAGGLGEFSHRSDGQHPTSVTQGTGSSKSGLNPSTSGSSDTTRKPSLMDRLNPRKDADGDGKPGFMK